MGAPNDAGRGGGVRESVVGTRATEDAGNRDRVYVCTGRAGAAGGWGAEGGARDGSQGAWGEDWFVRGDGVPGRAECLYERGNRRGREVRFVVARLTGDERWA